LFHPFFHRFIAVMPPDPLAPSSEIRFASDIMKCHPPTGRVVDVTWYINNDVLYVNLPELCDGIWDDKAKTVIIVACADDTNPDGYTLLRGFKVFEASKVINFITDTVEEVYSDAESEEKKDTDESVRLRWFTRSWNLNSTRMEATCRRTMRMANITQEELRELERRAINGLEPYRRNIVAQVLEACEVFGRELVHKHLPEAIAIASEFTANMRSSNDVVRTRVHHTLLDDRSLL
jgi:hypothetical protein